MSLNPGASLLPSSLILCSRDRPALLMTAVQSILGGDCLPEEFIVIDQSEHPNNDLQRLTASRADIRYLHSRTIGLSRAMNLGVRSSRHEVLVFTHDDVLVSRTWLRALIAALVQAGPRTVVTGRVLPGDPEVAGGFAPSTKTDEAPALYAGRIWEDVLYPMNMALFRSALAEVGGLDERLGPGTPFPGAEDNDLGFRLLEAGYSIAYVPQAFLHHRAWRAGYQERDLTWAYGRAQGGYYAKHLNLLDTYVLRRARSEIANHLAYLLQELRARQRIVRGPAVYVAGLVSGMCGWWLRYGLRELAWQDSAGVR